jgi:uncharacterized protein YecT (DUF1311 family)
VYEIGWAKTAELSNSHDILEVFVETTAAYDALLNKYYKALMAKLKGDHNAEEEGIAIINITKRLYVTDIFEVSVT